MKIRYYYIFVLTVFTVVACQTENTTENKVSFATVHAEKTYHLFDNPENPNYELKISFTYPEEYKDAKILKKIQTLFLCSLLDETYENHSPEEAVTAYVENNLSLYKEMESEFKEIKKSDTISMVRFFRYDILSNEIVLNQDGLISFRVSKENYSGGTHGLHAVINRVIDLRDGSFLTEDSIFVENFKDEMAQILLKNITAQNGLDDPEELKQHGFFELNNIVPNGNFLIDEKGITYSFNEYEIAAYSVGIVNVYCPYEQIKHLLRKECRH
jgi:hypothetical protein